MACYAGVVKASTIALLLPFFRMHEISVRQLIESIGPWVGGPAVIALLVKRGLLPSLVRSQHYPGLAHDLLACPLVLGLTVEKRMPWQAALVPHAIASLTSQVFFLSLALEIMVVARYLANHGLPSSHLCMNTLLLQLPGLAHFYKSIMAAWRGNEDAQQ